MAVNTEYGLDARELPRLLPNESAQLRFAQAGGNKPAMAGGRYSPSQSRAGLEALGYTPTNHIIAFINLKGGVGKTTSAVTLASRAVQFGRRTCLLDLDSQASASLALGVEAGGDTPVFLDVWQKPGEMLPGSLHRLQEFFHLLPSSLENGLLDGSLTQPAALKSAVARTCQVLAQEGFDLVVLDCPPSLGPAVVSSVCAADTIVIPMGADAFSLRGMELTLSEVRSIRQTFGLGMPRVRIVLAGVDRRISMWRQTLEQLRLQHGDTLMPGAIRTSSELPKALAKRRTLFANLARTKVRADYDRFSRDLLDLNELMPWEDGHGG